MADMHRPEHGGRLLQAARAFGIPAEDWLDLSTGIHPIGWPVPPVPAEVWRRLPEEEDGLLEAAAAYYGNVHLIATAGSQQALQALPYLRSKGCVGVLAPCYAEHAHAWKMAGHEVVELAGAVLPDELDVLLLVNPNNPTGRLIESATLLNWHAQLVARGGWLVVDEAFMDASPQHSLAEHGGMPGLVILRSLGKFFGLAGVRAGFVLAWSQLLVELQEKLGPWTLANPTRWIARQALKDRAWQQQNRDWLLSQSTRLADLLARHGLEPTGSTALFQYVHTKRAKDIHAWLASQGILLRLFEKPSALRIGLPGLEPGWERLTAALSG